MDAPGERGRMPISPAGNPNKRCGSAGFTLIELLVVVSIVSILALGVGLGSGGVFVRNSDSPRSVADRLADAVQSARDAALLGRAAIGFLPQTDGWLAVERDLEGDWRHLGPRSMTGRTTLRWQIDGRPFTPRLNILNAASPPPVMFLADGQSTAFGVTIGRVGDRITCATDGWGPFLCE